MCHADVQAVCCKRAYLRGAFLSSGSMSDPGKSYHFEIVCNTLERAQYLRQLMQDFGLEARIVRRKKNIIVYLKEGDRIVDALNVMDAPVALMELENVRILKDMRNNVNRKVNCETANINKTVSAQSSSGMISSTSATRWDFQDCQTDCGTLPLHGSRIPMHH